MISVAYHAHIRLKERLGIKSEDERLNIAYRAFERGEPIGFATRVWNGKPDQRILLRYQGHEWVFAQDGTLVTVLPRR